MDGMPLEVEHYHGYFALGFCARSTIGVEGAAPIIPFANIS
jgi:hypothetical protein